MSPTSIRYDQRTTKCITMKVTVITSLNAKGFGSDKLNKSRHDGHDIWFLSMMRLKRMFIYRVINQTSLIMEERENKK
jgi:hypothetical protein